MLNFDKVPHQRLKAQKVQTCEHLREALLLSLSGDMLVNVESVKP